MQQSVVLTIRLIKHSQKAGIREDAGLCHW
nr:MAG TPA: hypothetical protein [Bacteriophage sp.]